MPCTQTSSTNQWRNIADGSALFQWETLMDRSFLRKIRDKSEKEGSHWEGKYQTRPARISSLAQTIWWLIVSGGPAGFQASSAPVKFAAFFFFFPIHSSPSVGGCRCEAAVFKVASHTFAQPGRLGSHLPSFSPSFFFLFLLVLSFLLIWVHRISLKCSKPLWPGSTSFNWT